VCLSIKRDLPHMVEILPPNVVFLLDSFVLEVAAL